MKRKIVGVVALTFVMALAAAGVWLFHPVHEETPGKEGSMDCVYFYERHWELLPVSEWGFSARKISNDGETIASRRFGFLERREEYGFGGYR